MVNSDNRHRLRVEDREIILLGTAHVSQESADLVAEVIEEEKPDTVCVELCESRYKAMTQENRWKDTDLIKVIREKKAFLLLSNLMLAAFQKKIGKKLGIKPGEEMRRAVKAAEETGARIHLADRDIRTTLSRTWRLMGLWTKIKLLTQLLTSVGEVDHIEKADIEKMKEKDVLETLLAEIGDALPELRKVLIDERDQYLAAKIRTAPGKKIVAVVGAGHVPGIQRSWDKPVDVEALEVLPPRGKLTDVLKWGIPVLVAALIVLGFFMAGAEAGKDMVKWWVAANGIFAGMGALAALAHPITILTAMAASPITSLNPMIAAGWVAGLVEVFLRKPKVRDFESLPEDISSVKGFWKNKITRILLIVVLTNMGSSLGAFIAIPLMARLF
ncbi:MAG: TraB/GumN family protein [Deltaproteobacteria bacterium]|nr:TraB/GumN family protein [Deltaproteobacteria bacterium]MBW2047934.1 TraB/GumN family protein [Deltaproteobacteria bacterium]MBW2112334.1 TraB/GumN family protein [Deltaproteobacteria bacterium]MBW2352980.1 TraB/GumN family protein [Deltaproteobacteria bacterium]HDZ89372.1 TraB/GumN family protein [Deltaproteobacteria bacterium]